KAGQFECAQTQYEKALALCRTLCDTWAVSEAYYRLGEVKAQRSPLEAVALWKHNVLPFWRGTPREPVILNWMGIQSYGQDPARAARYHRKALFTTRGKGRHRERARALVGLITAYMFQGEVQEGLYTYLTALKLLHSKHDLSELYGRMGYIFLEMGDFENALQSADKSLEISQNLIDR